MPVFIVVALVLAVFYFAGKGPAEAGVGGSAQSPVRTETVPMVGNSAPISPAMTGGAALINQQNAVRLDVSAATPSQAGAVVYDADARLTDRRVDMRPADTTDLPTAPLPSARSQFSVGMGSGSTFGSFFYDKV